MGTSVFALSLANQLTQAMPIRERLAARELPTITLWNRLEARPRTKNFERALRAEVRDALWMITRQWQMGEFEGDDAGSPIFAKVHIRNTRLTRYQPGDEAPEEFDETLPLETEVERRPIVFEQATLRPTPAPANTPMHLDLRLLMGRQWLRLSAAAGNFEAAFLALYPIDAVDPLAAWDAGAAAHPEVWASFLATAGRRLDGYKLHQHLTAAPGNLASDGIVSNSGEKTALDAAGAKFLAWFARQFNQPPGGPGAWTPDRLEYRFSCSAPKSDGAEKVLTADEYFHGHLDWYNVDIDPDRDSLGGAPPPLPVGVPSSETKTLIPTAVTFEGMPNTRWWKFEDGHTNFGDIKPDTVELAKLLLIEFGLVYANDWFLIPYELPAGSISTVAGVAVTNVFGERTWVEAAGRGGDDDWQRWSMFGVNIKGVGEPNDPQQADTSLLILPTAAKVLEGRPLEDVRLVRDEMANMVWAVEKIVPLRDGDAKYGGESGMETREFFRRDVERRFGGVPIPAPALVNDAKIRFDVMNTVPEHWIPFIPVHVPGDNREIQLQRAAMPRIIEGDQDTPVKIRPRTHLIRAGLDLSAPASYLLHEEEVPRSGVRVIQSFQRCRWRDGQVYTWLGVRKQTGRGEGSSGLAFDRIVEKK